MTEGECGLDSVVFFSLVIVLFAIPIVWAILSGIRSSQSDKPSHAVSRLAGIWEGRKAGLDRFGAGLLVCAAGVGFTYFTYQHAPQTGGQYALAYGAILGGAGMMVDGILHLVMPATSPENRHALLALVVIVLLVVSVAVQKFS